MKATVVRAIAFPLFGSVDSPLSYRQAAVWSLRILLALTIFLSFYLSPPRAERLTMILEFGRRAASGHFGEIGWLGSLCAYLLERAAGFAGLAAGSAASVIATLALVELRTRPRAGVVLSLISAIIVALGFLDVWRVGAGATSWVWAAALLLVFDRMRGVALVASAAGIAIVWCNVAPEGIFAPLLASLVAIGRTLEDAGDGRRATFFAVAATAAATLCTPAGFAYPAQASWAAHLHASLAEILPIAPHLVAPKAYQTAFILILIAGAALGARRKWDGVLLLGAGLIAVLRNGADAPLLGIVAAPMLADAFARMQPEFTTSPPPRERVWDALVALAAALAACALLLISLTRTPHAPEPSAPAAILHRYAADGRSHRLYCSVLEWCDQAAATPNLRPFADSRVDRVDAERRATQRAIARVTIGWSARLARARIDAVLTHRTDALASLLALSPHWSIADAEGDLVLFER